MEINVEKVRERREGMKSENLEVLAFVRNVSLFGETIEVIFDIKDFNRKS